MGLGDIAMLRMPQSAQSEPSQQDTYSAPVPPSSQSPSFAKLHVSPQPGGGDGGDIGGEGAVGGEGGGRQHLES